MEGITYWRIFTEIILNGNSQIKVQLMTKINIVIVWYGVKTLLANWSVQLQRGAKVKW